MSRHTYQVWGEGHLASVMRCGLEIRGLLGSGSCKVDQSLLFIAEDIIDHQNETQIKVVADFLEDAGRSCSDIVVVSQVPPGCTRSSALARKVDLRRVFYQADTIIVRRAVERMVHPEQFIVGCADPSEPLPLAYQEYLAAHECPVLQMSYESAELAKCAINYFLAAQIRTTNELSGVAKVIGANWDDVVQALRGDARIGPHAYLRPGSLNQHLLRDVETIQKMLE